ncbi:MAG: TolC family protein [Parabacteroides sp.]
MAWGQAEGQTVRLTLREAIERAHVHSVDAAVALNELRTAYWEYRTHRADQLPEVIFTGTLPSYYRQYAKYQQSDGAYTYVRNNSLGLNGEISITQNIALTGGKVSLNSSLDFTSQLGTGSYNEFMSVPVRLTLSQPIFGVNDQKWKRRIEPVRYEEAKASFMEQVEQVTLTTINYYFNLLLAEENRMICRQNLQNADKLYDIAVAKRKIGHISESELMQLKLSALQAKGKLTEAQSQYDAMMFQLRSFLGLSEQDLIEPVVPEAVAGIRMDYQEVLLKAHENNALAKNIRRRQLEADYNVATAKGNQRSVNLFASIGYTGKDRKIAGAYNPLKDNQVVEVGVSIPLLDWGKRKGKVKVAESNRDVVLSQLRKEEMDFNQDIFLLVQHFNNQADQLEIAAEADLLAEKRYQTSIETFMVGKISILDLNDAQSSKDEAKQKHIQELYFYWYYFYNIRSMTLYDFMNRCNLDADFESLVKR